MEKGGALPGFVGDGFRINIDSTDVSALASRAGGRRSDLIRYGGAFGRGEARGMGKLLFDEVVSNPGWMPGATEELRRDFAGLLRRYGEFEPNVSCDAVPLSVIPYRAVNGDLVLYVVNPTVRALDACFDVKASLIRHNGIVRDMWSGRELEVERRGNRVLTRTQIQPMGAATILFRSR